MKNKILNKLFIAIVLSSFLPSVLFAQTNYSAQEVIDNVYNRAIPTDQEGELIMTLENSNGAQRIRIIEQHIKETSDDTKKIMFFTSPADVRGTSFMSFSYDNQDNDDQWIYLPALKKVKRISSGSSNDYFMGSDFTYDDMGERLPTEDIHSIIGEEVINGENCIIVESIPKDSDYMYSKTITWISNEYWLGMKKEFYDEEGDILKTLSVTDFNQIDGFWMITGSTMYNLQKEHKTIIELKDTILDSGIDDSIFSTRTMTKGIR